MECLEFRRGRVEQGLEVRYPERSGGQRWIRLRRDRRGQYRRQGNCMRAPAPVERQAITILLLRPARCFTWSLALPRLGAARPLLFAREHEVLFAGYAPAPQKCGADYERQERIADSAKHELLSIMLLPGHSTWLAAPIEPRPSGSGAIQRPASPHSITVADAIASTKPCRSRSGTLRHSSTSVRTLR